MLVLPQAEPLFFPISSRATVKYILNVHIMPDPDGEMKGGAVGLDQLAVKKESKEIKNLEHYQLLKHVLFLFLFSKWL